MSLQIAHAPFLLRSRQYSQRRPRLQIRLEGRKHVLFVVTLYG
jgi:hypothetical protein